MGLHEVPHDLQTVDIVEGEEWVVVAVVAGAADHLVAAVAAAPAPTRHKSGAAEAGEVARNQAPPHRLDCPINAMFILFILGIRKSKIKQNGYFLFFHFLLLNISHICRLAIIIN